MICFCTTYLFSLYSCAWPGAGGRLALIYDTMQFQSLSQLLFLFHLIVTFAQKLYQNWDRNVQACDKKLKK